MFVLHSITVILFQIVPLYQTVIHYCNWIKKKKIEILHSEKRKYVAIFYKPAPTVKFPQRFHAV